MAVEKLRRYELIYLVHPDAEEAQLSRMEERINQVTTDFEALVIKREDWGKRKLSYEIEKVNKAYYRYLEFVVRPTMIAEIERVLRLTDVVIRYQTIKLEDGIPADGLDRFEVVNDKKADAAPAAQEAAPAVVESADSAESAEGTENE
jgi:small subunit ribosomal protein S6